MGELPVLLEVFLNAYRREWMYTMVAAAAATATHDNHSIVSFNERFPFVVNPKA